MHLTRQSLLSRSRIPALSVAVAALVTLTAVLLIALIRIITNLAFFGKISTAEAAPDFSHWGAWGILVPVIGGLIIGVMARYGSPAIRGHGIPEAMQAIGTADSRIPARVAVLKPVSAAISIGTGGPFGAEGPIIATGGALGSLMGQWLPSSPVQRKILLAAGAAAGMTAIFGTPLAAVLLTIELLLFEFRGRSFLPVALAAGTAMALRSCFHEPLPMFPLHFTAAPTPSISLASFLTGAVCGLLAVGVTRAVYALEDAFEKLPLHWMWWPAIGGVAVGLIGWLDHRTLGVGYDNLRQLLDGHLTTTALVTLAVWKFLSWWIALGSGTSGGTLAPLMTVGGAAGALMAHALHAALPGFADFPVGLAAAIGMAATFAGASRAFLASVAFAYESTQAVTAFGPLLLGCGAAVLVSRVLMRETIMTEKLARRAVRIPSEYEPDSLHGLTVREVMEPLNLTVPPEEKISVLAARMGTPGSPWHDVRLVPVVDDGRLLAVIARADVFAALESAPDSTVLEAGVRNPVTAESREALAEAIDRMILHGIGRLPVIDSEAPGQLVGLLTRRAVLDARQRRHGVPAAGAGRGERN